MTPIPAAVYPPTAALAASKYDPRKTLLPLPSQLIQLSKKDHDVEVDAASCKALAARAVREAAVFVEPTDVLRKVAELPDFAKTGPKCCSPALLAFLQNGSTAEHCETDVTPEPAEEETRGDHGPAVASSSAAAAATTTTTTPATLDVPEATVTKAWAWMKATRELKKATTLAAACNAIAFLCHAKGHGLFWGDELEADLEATLKDALLECESITKVDCEESAQKIMAAASAAPAVPAKAPLTLSALAAADPSAQKKMIGEGLALRPLHCARVEMEVAHGFDSHSHDAYHLRNMLMTEVFHQYKRRGEANPIKAIHVGPVAGKANTLVEVLAELAEFTTPAPSGTNVPLDLAHVLQRRAGVGPLAKAEAEARLAAAVEALHARPAAEQHFCAFSEALFSEDFGDTSLIIGQFFGSGGANMKAFIRSLEACLGTELAAASSVQVDLVDGVVTVFVSMDPTELHRSKQDGRALKAKVLKLLNEAVAEAKAKAKGKASGFSPRPAKVHRFRYSRPFHFVPHFTATVHKASLGDDYVSGKKMSRMQLYRGCKSYCGCSDTNLRAHKQRKQRKAFCSPKLELEGVAKAQQSKVRNAPRLTQQERRALKARLPEASKSDLGKRSEGKKGASKRRSKARSCKLGFSADFAADPSYVY